MCFSDPTGRSPVGFLILYDEKLTKWGKYIKIEQIE